MKRKISIFDVVLFAYIIGHVCYTAYMFIQSITYGAVWLIITGIEIFLVVLGLKHSRGLLMALIVMMLISSLSSLSILMLGADSDRDDAEYALVLGYALSDNQISETLKLRLDTAYEYAISNPKTKLVLCGGKTGKNTVSEASVMYDYLIDLGINPNRLIKEDKSTDTIENIQNSLKVINRYSKIVVISSDYHVYRASLICQKLGLDVHTLGSYSPLLLMPNALLFEKLGIIKTLIMLN